MAKENLHESLSHSFRLGNARIKNILLIYGSPDLQALGAGYRFPNLDLIADEGPGFLFCLQIGFYIFQGFGKQGSPKLQVVRDIMEIILDDGGFQALVNPLGCGLIYFDAAFNSICLFNLGFFTGQKYIAVH
jgi:hypothetical protein